MVGGKGGGSLQTLLADARQGVVGGLVWLGLTALAALLFGVVGGEVPVWVLGAVVVVGGVVVVALVAGYERRLAELRGRLSATGELVAVLRAEAKNMAPVEDPPLSTEARSIVKRINALQADLERVVADGQYRATDSQVSSYDAVVADYERSIGPSGLVDRAKHASDPEYDSTVGASGLLTMLGQLEAGISVSVGT